MRPVNEAELAEAIRGANGPLHIRGGGTRRIGAATGEVLETGGLAGVSLYEPGALTLVAGAGTPLAEVEALLAGERQRLPFEVPDLRGLLGRGGESTLGGVAAANASGPRRVQVGACRDALLGVRFVDGRGDVIKSGGRVMKNVTGYDLVKLLAGSWGTLGVISEVSVKVQAVPEAEATLSAPMAIGPAVAAMAAGLGSPYDLSGAAWCAGAVRLRLEGMAGSVAYRSERLAAHLGGDWQVVTGAASAALWREVRDVLPLQSVDGPEEGLTDGLAGAPVWRVSVKPSDAVALLVGLEGAALLDWGGGLVWYRGAGDLRGRAAALGGHATLVRGAGVAFHPEAPAVACLAAGLRATFDPRGILNTGLMG